MSAYAGIVGTEVFVATAGPEKYVTGTVLATYTGAAGSEARDDSVAAASVTAADILIQGLANVKLSKVRKDAASPITVTTNIPANASAVVTGKYFTLAS